MHGHKLCLYVDFIFISINSVPQLIVYFCIWDLEISILPFITQLIIVKPGLAQALLAPVVIFSLLYHTDNIPDYSSVWKGWESLPVQCCLKRCPDYWVKWPGLSCYPTKTLFQVGFQQYSSWSLFLNFVQNLGRKREQYLLPLAFMTFY